MIRFSLSTFTNLRLLGLFVAWGVAVAVHADQHDSQRSHWNWESFDWHGFISQGYSKTNTNNFLGSSSNGSFDFNEAAINGSWRPHSRLQFGAQLLYVRTGSAKPKGTNLDYAVLDWRAVEEFGLGAGVRVGRLKHPYGFFNETRDVVATRPGILLPESIYVSYLREVIHSSDSVGLYAHHALDQGTVSFDSTFGKPIVDNDTVRSLLGGNPTNGELDNDRVFVSRLSFEHGSGLWRSAFSYARFQGDFTPGAGEPYLAGEAEMEQMLLSLELNYEGWQVLSEYQWRDITYRKIFFNTNIVKEGLAYYTQLSYQFTPKFNLYLRRDHIYQDKHDKDGTKNAAMTGRPAHDGFSKEMVVGIRYEPSYDWTLGVEFHKINGTLWLPDIENPVVSEQKQRWNMLLLQAAYRF